MAYANSEASPFINVKKAYASVRSFVDDLYGGSTGSYMTLEELELDADAGVWLITVALGSPTAFIVGKPERDLKQFVVNATNGEVISMKMYNPKK